MKNNFTGGEDSISKPSLHSSNVKSPSKINKNRKKSYNRYEGDKLTNSRTTFNSSLKNYKSKMPSENNVIEFNDVKWLSIISIYDPKKLKYVTASYNSYNRFLKNNDVRKDQYGKN